MFKENETDGMEMKKDDVTTMAFKIFGGALDEMRGEDEENKEDFLLNKKKIISLQDERILKEERNFLHVIEKDSFEKLDAWKPDTCIGKLGWKLCYYWYCFRYFIMMIQSHNAFEACSLLVIMANSVTLA